MAYQLKIFTITRNYRLSVAERLGFDLKGLICTVDRQWCYREGQKHTQNIWALGPLWTAGPTGTLYRLLPPLYGSLYNILL